MFLHSVSGAIITQNLEVRHRGGVPVPHAPARSRDSPHSPRYSSRQPSHYRQLRTMISFSCGEMTCKTSVFQDIFAICILSKSDFERNGHLRSSPYGAHQSPCSTIGGDYTQLDSPLERLPETFRTYHISLVRNAHPHLYKFHFYRFLHLSAFLRPD